MSGFSASCHPRAATRSSTYVSIRAPEQQSPAEWPPTNTTRRRWIQIAAWANTANLLLFSPAILILLGWFTEGYQDTVEAGDVSHRLHEVLFGVLFTCALIGSITQIRRPEQNTAGFLQLCVVVGLLSTLVWWTNGWETGLVLYLVPLIALAVARSPGNWRPGKTWWAALLMAAPMALVLVDGASSHISLALDAAQNHTTHWTAVAAFEASLLGMIPIVALRLPGYRVTLATLAGATFVYGTASLTFPYDASSHRAEFSAALLVWAAGWMLLWYRESRPHREPRRNRPLLATGVAMAMVLFGMVAPRLNEPPNVPHRPDPSVPELMVADISRETCQGCHSTGQVGAPVQTSSHLAQRCSGDCPATTVTCLGCHQIDPVFERTALSDTHSTLVVIRSNQPAVVMTAEMLIRAREMAEVG